MTLTIVLLLAGSLAGAQPAGADPDERARQLFLDGDAHYAAGRYEEAVENFIEAYELSGRPALLYNLANVYERLSDYESAADYLRRYLQTPEVHDVVSVRERLRRLELAAARAAASRPASLATESEEGSRLPRWPAWTLGLATAGGAVSSVALGLLTLEARSEAESRCAEAPGGATLCRQSASEFLDQERERALATDLAIGVTAVLGTATFAYVVARASQRGGEKQVAARPIVGPDGGGLQLVFRPGTSP